MSPSKERVLITFFYPLVSVLAQSNDDNGAAAATGVLALFGALFCGALLVGLIISIIVCWYLSNILKAIPPEHRQQQPNMVWLLLIPILPLVWNFFVYPKIADSFKSYFNSIGRTDVGDCGRGLSLAFCIIFCCLIIPYLNSCAGLAMLVLWIIILVKFGGLKTQLLQSQAAASAAPLPPSPLSPPAPPSSTLTPPPPPI